MNCLGNDIDNVALHGVIIIYILDTYPSIVAKWQNACYDAPDGCAGVEMALTYCYYMIIRRILPPCKVQKLFYSIQVVINHSTEA